MRLLIDANILLDVLQKREPHYRDSALIWKLCETEQAEGYVSTLAFADLVYVMRKELDPQAVEDVQHKLALIFRFADLTAADITHAGEMKWEDFEYSVQSATAKRIHADHIITRNVRDFKQSKIVVFTPTEFLARI